MARSRRSHPTRPRSSAATARPYRLRRRTAVRNFRQRPSSLPQFSPLKLKTGQWHRDPGGRPRRRHGGQGGNFKVGDTVSVATLGAKHRYEVTGIATFGGVDSLGGATIAIWDLPTAQKLLDKQGQFDSISIAAKDGTSSADLVRAVQPLVPASLEVKDAEQQAAADARTPT